MAPADAARAYDALSALALQPLLGRPLEGPLRPARRIEFGTPGGWFRAAYVVLPDRGECVVFGIGPSAGFYERVTRRFHALKREYGL
jgi:hypothetical protein